MLLGDAAYDVEPGWIGVPVGPFADYAAARARGREHEPAAGKAAPSPEATKSSSRRSSSADG